jgi:hypothetical protein
MPRKVPKEVVKRMIASGRYTITILGGTKITDWKKLFEDAPEAECGPLVEGKGWPDGADQLAITGISIPPVDSSPVPKPMTEPAHVVINGKKYTVRQLEHFGDSVVGLAVRTMTYEKCGSDQRLYFHYTQRMITNKNLGHGQTSRGTDAEVEIGKVFAEKGLEASLVKATEIVKATEAWLSLEKLLETE